MIMKWETIIDFTEICTEGVSADEVLEVLSHLELVSS